MSDRKAFEREMSQRGRSIGQFSVVTDGYRDPLVDLLWQFWQEAVRQERERYKELVTLYQHSAMTDDEFTIKMIDLIDARSHSTGESAQTS